MSRQKWKLPSLRARVAKRGGSLRHPRHISLPVQICAYAAPARSRRRKAEPGTRNRNPDCPLLFRRARERAVILIHQIAICARHFVGGVQRRLVPLRVLDSPPQSKFETLQSLGDLGLQPLELPRILVDAVIVELAHGAQHLIEISWIHAVVAQLLAQSLRFAGPVPCLIAEIPNFTRRIDPLAPSAPVVTIGRRAAKWTIAERA